MTAVEWLQEEIKSLTGLNLPETVVNQAKEMEKKQKQKAFKKGKESVNLVC